MFLVVVGVVVVEVVVGWGGVVHRPANNSSLSGIPIFIKNLRNIASLKELST